MGVFEKTIVDKERIVDLIPQRSPFIFVDSFYGEKGGEFCCGFTPNDRTLFTKMGYMYEAGIVENMAQSAAASTGWSYRERGDSVPVGYIGAVSDFELYKLPNVGIEIKTFVRFCGEFGGISLVETESRQGDDLIAKGKLKIFINENSAK